MQSNKPTTKELGKRIRKLATAATVSREEFNRVFDALYPEAPNSFSSTPKKSPEFKKA